jgi:hypothetical protein
MNRSKFLVPLLAIATLVTVPFPAVSQPTATDKQVAVAAFMWFFSDNTMVKQPFEALGAAMRVPSASEEVPPEPEILEGEFPDRTQSEPFEGNEYVPAGTRARTYGSRIFTSAQGQEATIDFNFNIDQQGGGVRTRGGVDGSVTTSICPSAAGVIAGKFRIETKARFDARGIGLTASNEFIGRFQASVGDNAVIKNLDMQADVARSVVVNGEEAEATARFTSRSKLKSSPNDKGDMELDRDGSMDFDVEARHGWYESEFFGKAHALAWLNLEAAILEVLLPRVQQMFRNNYCVAMEYRGVAAENNVEPVSTTNMTVAVKHKFENRDVSLPATHRIKGEGRCAPGAMPATPAAATYTAPADPNPASPFRPWARIYGRSVSKRGIGRASVYFQVKSKKPKPPPVTAPTPPPVLVNNENPVRGTVSIKANINFTDARLVNSGNPTKPGESYESVPEPPGYLQQNWRVTGSIDWLYTNRKSRLDSQEGPITTYSLSGEDSGKYAAAWTTTQLRFTKCIPQPPARDLRTNTGSISFTRKRQKDVFLKIIGSRATATFELPLPQTFDLYAYTPHEKLGTYRTVTEGEPCDRSRALPPPPALNRDPTAGLTGKYPEPILRGPVAADGTIKGQFVIRNAYGMIVGDGETPQLRKRIPVDITVNINFKVPPPGLAKPP